MGFDFTLIAPLLPSHCGFSSVFGCGVSFLVSSSVFLSMIVQQLVVILVFSQEGVRARLSTLPFSFSPSKCLIEFACEAIWSWGFVCWKIFNHSFKFSACNWSVYFFLFLPGSVSEVCAFLRICPFLPGCPFYCHRVAYNNLS